ncbi:MAG TPA: hypothetical protein ENK46_12440 [Flavobacteriia bacterium]|nr:hypothetical protein [Flavobacteriia bacterium]
MKITHFIISPLILLSFVTVAMAQSETTAILKDSARQKDAYRFTVENSVINKALWQQPYRYEDKNLKTLSVRIVVRRVSAKKEALDFNSFTLLDESKKLRIRPSGVYYPKRDKKKYLKSKPVNDNYNDFKDSAVEGYANFEAKTFKVNILGLKKKNIVPTVKSLKKLTLKAKSAVYYLDFPVQEEFSYGKIYYQNKPIGFAAVKN